MGTNNQQTKGLKFPVELSNGSSKLTEGMAMIQSSLKTIVSWPLYTRPFNGNFGTRIFETLEEPNDSVLYTLVRKFIIDSIALWESRIDLIDIKVSRPLPEKLVVELVYRVKDLNIMDSLFYEYYIN